MTVGGWPGILVCNQCPRCNSPLRGVPGARFDARKCPSCKGIWVDNAGSRALATNGDAEIERAAAAKSGEHAEFVGIRAPDRETVAALSAVGERWSAFESTFEIEDPDLRCLVDQIFGYPDQ